MASGLKHHGPWCAKPLDRRRPALCRETGQKSGVDRGGGVMWLSHSSRRHGIRRKIIVACALGSLLLTSSANPACAQENARYTFEALHPEFLKTSILDY